MTPLQNIERRARRLSDKNRAVLAARLIESLPPFLADNDDGLAEAIRRDAEMDADPTLGMSPEEFRSAVLAARKR